MSAVSDELKIIAVSNKRERDIWLRIPWTVMGDDPHFVPPLLMVEKSRIDPKQNPFYGFGEAELFLAFRGKRPVGRISAQINRLSNEHLAEKAGHFGFFDCLNDQEVASALINKAEDFARSRGMNKLVGPYNLSINQECGVLVEGFDSPACVMMPQNPAYYDQLITHTGLKKAADLLAYRIDLNAPLPLVDKMQSMAQKTNNISIRLLNKKHLRQELRIMVDIFNQAWADNWGFVPMSDAEIDAMAKEMAPLVPPEAGCFAAVDGEEQAMLIALPDLNALIKNFNGKLFPLNWARMLWRLKRGPLGSSRIILLGLLPKYQGTLMGAALLAKLLTQVRENGKKWGVDWVEISWILENNRPMVSLAESGGAKLAKRYRLYEREL